MAEIGLVDVSMRDGNQSLWGATGLATNHMLQVAGLLDRVGFRAVDFTSSSHMAVAVRYFQDNPWERIRRMRAAMPIRRSMVMRTRGRWATARRTVRFGRRWVECSLRRRIRQR